MWKAVVMTMLLTPALVAAQPPTFDEARAVEQARDALAEVKGTTREAFSVTSVEPHTWNDSSLGCGKRGTMAAQMITEGYVVVLSAQGRDHTVHVAASHAVVCDRPTLTKRGGNARRVRGLDLMLQAARDDLAQRLDADPKLIRVSGMRPTKWADSAMECPLADEEIQLGPLMGYRLSLQYQGQIYTYHTDMNGVRPCPAIEKS